MDKKLLAIAVAGAMGTPVLAQAQASTVQVFGNFYYEYAWIDQGRGPAGDRVNVDMMQTPGSQIGFKGEEKLGGGLAAWFQCVSTADLRGQSQDGWCSRNSAVGFKGTFGNVWVGNWDTAFKRVNGVNRIVNLTGAFGVSFLLTGGATTVNGAATPGLFSRRQSNSINYESPNFGGFRLMVSTSATNTSTGNLTTATANKPRLWSFGALYNNGPITLGGGYESHKDFQPVAGVSGTDKAWSASAGYQVGPARLGAMYVSRKYQTGPGTDLKVNSWNLAADWKISGPHGLRAGYTRANDTTGGYTGTISGSSSTIIGNAGAGGTGASLWQIHYVNTLSKRTQATFGYARLDNKNNARYALGGVAAPAAGTDQHVWGLGLRHRF